jgi:hypothetical protein
MNYSILLVVEKPDMSNLENERKWTEFLKYTKGVARQDKAIQMQGINVLLIEIENTLDSLRDALNRCAGLNYKYAIFPEGLEWHEPSPLANQG